MKKYRLKVIEKHSDIVTVRANTIEEARDLAIYEADPYFECLYDIEVLSVEDDESDN